MCRFGGNRGRIADPLKVAFMFSDTQMHRESKTYIGTSALSLFNSYFLRIDCPFVTRSITATTLDGFG